ncbi:hypothetical protein HYALB_00006119 [Hymenoscyphus albidus]|uniref:HTH CENPB-type domain-containing protein n=1 Tax=Hymenoscyphus albidus TaxID=595503 RepID=A0A9N9LNI8_9HELO|nr:hypothetical protein HYALB_00006119 [Hymenoscyphus albidus]
MPRSKKELTQRESEELLIRRLQKVPIYQQALHLEREERIAEAIRAYRDPENTDITTLEIAVGVYNILYSTMGHRKKGRRTIANNGGHNRRLNEAAESTLIKYCYHAEESRYLLNYSLITQAASAISRSIGDNKPLGHSWTNRWTKRMVQEGRFKTLNTTLMDILRRTALTRDNIQGYFNRLFDTIKMYNIQLCNMYNMDEAGF